MTADNEKSFKVTHNKFSDWTQDEYEGILGWAQPEEKKSKNESGLPEAVNQAVPDSIDWREQGFVSDVVDQGQCGAGWAFATIGALEGAYAVQQGSLTPLSVQQAIDCTGQSTGCKGGKMR